jgi:menaquinone-9 beta-reductase
MKEFDVGIIGGGPSGSFTALLLASEGYNVCLFEKKSFPRETLCGEFLSYEVSNHLKDAGLFEKFLLLNPNKITSFRLVTTDNQSVVTDLKFTAFGLRRSVFDNFLLEEAAAKGVTVYQPYAVTSVKRNGDQFILSADTKRNAGAEVKVKRLIGAYGKTNPIDRLLKRGFSEASTPYNGIKIHLPAELFKQQVKNEIQIYTSHDLYCGVNGVDNGLVTICFLEKRGVKDPPVREKFLILRKNNPGFDNILKPEADKFIVNAKVYGTGSIYFGRKDPVENGVFMTGDAAGVIAPLAGDGIGMAMESAVLLKEVLTNNGSDDEKGNEYAFRWKKKFRRRIITAGLIQKVILSEFLMIPGTKLLKVFPRSINSLIDYTRK